MRRPPRSPAATGWAMSAMSSPRRRGPPATSASGPPSPSRRGWPIWPPSRFRRERIRRRTRPGRGPYRYPPSAPQLVPLRVPPYFPAPAGCGRLGQAPGCTTLNRPSDRTIYPPVAEAWFDVVHFVVPGGPVRQWQLAGAAVDMATLGLLMIGLRGLGRDPREAAWYALCPVPV